MEKKSKKKIAPIIISILVILVSLAYISTFVFLIFADIVILPIAAVAIVVYLGICGAIIAVLRERIKEINGGQEDATLNY
ncbi:MAG: hypothetical protein IK955_03195 [Clostridia bacterium]|nr:hypothetical protein [Clostridia bacterium]